MSHAHRKGMRRMQHKSDELNCSMRGAGGGRMAGSMAGQMASRPLESRACADPYLGSGAKTGPFAPALVGNVVLEVLD